VLIEIYYVFVCSVRFITFSVSTPLNMALILLLRLLVICIMRVVFIDSGSICIRSFDFCGLTLSDL